MMGQQKRPFEAGGSTPSVKCMKQSASRSKEASEWLKANPDSADEDSEQMDLTDTGKDASGHSSKQRNSHQELAFWRTPKGGATKVPQAGVAAESSIFIPQVQNPSDELRSSHLEEKLLNNFSGIPCSGGRTLLGRDEKDAQCALSRKKTRTEHKSCEGEVRVHDTSSLESTHDGLSANFAFVKIVQRALEARKVKAYRPLPVMMGGKEVNLFSLSIMVKGIGGYIKATESGSWRKISEGLGFGSDCGPCLKLIYVKYLKLLESGKILGLNLCTSDPRSEALNPKPSNVDQIPKQGYQSTSSEAVNVATKFRSMKTSRLNRLCDKRNVATEFRLAKISKHDPLCDAVRWIRRVALEPGNPEKGQGLRRSQKNEHWIEYCATLATNMCSHLRKNTASNVHLHH